MNDYNKKNLKVCVCTCGKEENKYIIEFVNHYINYGIDKIYIYDNNDINGERFETILSDYIKNNSVEILNYRGAAMLKFQMIAFDKCYKQLNKIFDWIIFYDIDEFIHLKHYHNIKDYLNQYHFKKCNVIYLNHVIHTDNDQIYYYNESLFKRFPKKYEFNKEEITPETYRNKDVIKAILRGNLNLTNITFFSPHILSHKISNTCNGNGKIIKQGKNHHLKNPDYTNYYYDHFFFKSSEEFLNKLTKGDVFYKHKKKNIKLYLIKYFSFNKINEKKLNYFLKNLYIDKDLNFSKTKPH